MKTLIVISGPTASGKTRLAIETALHLNTEILSADSRQCYKEMNIGVAKPTSTELKSVQHHFINSHSIHDSLNASIYEKIGLSILDSLFEKNDFVICVGGTGMYIKALCEGLDDMPPVNKQVYDEMNAQYKTLGKDWLINQIIIEDPLYSAHGEILNPQRTLRALAFVKTHGKSIIHFKKNTKKKRSFDVQYFAIAVERDNLYKQINERVDIMMQEGLLAEVKSLYKYKQLNAMQTVGYNELIDYLDGEITLDDAVEKIKQHTRNYAKRQMTWCKHQQKFQWIAPHYENIINTLNKLPHK